MKRLALLMIPALLLAGCTNKNYELNLTVAAPAGAPSACLYKYLAGDKVEVLAAKDASNLVSYMQNKQKDVVILPTNAGVMAITKQNVEYKIAATITFGNLFIGATGHDADGVLDADDYVVLIQKGNVPDKLFQYCYGDLGLTNTHYIEAPTTNVSAVLATGKDPENSNADVDYVLIAEPAFTAAKAQNASVTQYASLQEKYKEKSGDKEITQASVFVSNSADKEEVDKFLAQLEKDIKAFVNNPSILDKYVKDFDSVTFAAKFGVPSAQMLKNVTTNGNRMGLGYKSAKENKESIDQFLSLWPAIGTTSEEIYY